MASHTFPRFSLKLRIRVIVAALLFMNLVLVSSWLSCRRRVVCSYKGNETRDYGLTFSTLNPRLGKRIDYALLRLGSPTLHLCDIETCVHACLQVH